MIKTILHRVVLVVMLICLAQPVTVRGHDDERADNIGVTERTGQLIPLGMTFQDENGAQVRLKNLVTKPTILTLVYYSCNSVCPLMLGGLATALGALQLTPGVDYAVITISFDEEDTPALAKQKKINYIKATGLQFPGDAWKFLTGDRQNIARITEAVGFAFREDFSTRTVGFGSRKESRGFIHPSVLIFLAPNGRITRYMYVDQSHYGTAATVGFSTTNIQMALTDASTGKTWPGSKNPIRLCFPNLSEEGARFYTLMSGVALGALLCLALLFFYLRRTGRGKFPKRKDL